MLRLHADIVELDHRGQRAVAVMDRLIGSDKHRIDYRHIASTLWCASLARSAGMCSARQLFPSLGSRRAYDALALGGADQADLDYVRILHPSNERRRTVRAKSCSRRCWPAGITPTYEAVRAEVRGERMPEGTPSQSRRITPPDLAVYDRLLGANTAAVCV